MIFNDEKNFQKEIEAIKQHGQTGESLSLTELNAIKQRVLAAVQNQGEEPVSSWRLRATLLVRYAVSVLVGLSLVGGTAYAASGAIPGDFLYTIKRAEEKVRLSVAVNSQSKANIQAKFAQERLDELGKISAQLKSANQGQNEEHPNMANSSSSTPAAENKLSTTTNVQINKYRQLQIQAKQQAGLEVSNALKALEKVQASLEAQGNTKASTAVSQNIIRLKAKALEQNLNTDNIKTPGQSGVEHGQGQH